MKETRTAVVTGATKGIGAAICRKLAAEGFALCICARNEGELADFARELGTLGSAGVSVYAADLADTEQAKAFAQYALLQLTAIDILVNNAGVFIPGDLCAEPEGQLQHMMSLNVYAAYAITRIIVPVMKQRTRGHIFNMCSVASLKAYPQGGSYSISKYALLGFSDNLREELKQSQVRVTAICPGATLSRSWEGSGVPDERLMPPEDIAEVLWTAYRLSGRSDMETVVIRPQFGDL